MALNEGDVPGIVKMMLGYREAERPRLSLIRSYIKSDDPTQTSPLYINGQATGPFAWLPSTAPPEVKRIASISNVNVLRFVVNAVVQVMYVDGFRAPKAADEEPVWETWQVNRMDARQIGVHRSALSYGNSFGVVTDGDPAPVIRGLSPHRMTVVYDGAGDDWPMFALEQRRGQKGKRLFRLYDDRLVWTVAVDDQDKSTVLSTAQHGAPVVPVVRFRPTIDDDEDGEGASDGDVMPLITIQDQINMTTFGLLVAQHFGAFRQRYILGWMADSEAQAVEASARRLWTFDDPDINVGEFGQTDLSGYINSREASLRHLATISQTPAHELLGQLVNLSADALAAAEATFTRKVAERQVVMGEAWEQVLELAGGMQGYATDPMSYVRWRDTEARSLSQVADALGKIVTMLGVPPQELWERIPGVSQQEVERWKAAAKEGDAIAQLTAILDRQAAGAPVAGSPDPMMQSQTRG